MASTLSQQDTPFISFERGIDREDPRSAIEKGAYDAAVNIGLRRSAAGDSSAHVATLDGDLSLDTQISWPSGNKIFVAPFTYSTYTAASATLTFSTHLIYADDTGAVYRYDAGAPGTTTLVRRGFAASQKYWTHAVYDQWLLTLNGRDAPMKYGQHFLGTNQNEARPFLFPLGSKPITPVGAAIADETWTHTNSSFVNDASVPGGGSRVHTQSLKVNHSGTDNAFVEWGTNHDFLTGPFPYGGTDFSTSDFLVLQVFKAAGGSTNVRIRFGDSAGTNRFDFTVAISGSSSWQTIRVARSTAVTTGSPNWNSIKRVTFFNDSAADDVYFDDAYFLYANAPPALQVATYHKNRIVGGGAPVAGSSIAPALGTLYWSRAVFPDEFPPANTLVISGGTNALSRANQITAIREFGASCMVGTPHSIAAFTLDSQGSPHQQIVTNEHGIDSHKAMIETPNGALIFPWQKALYVIRSTWRAYGTGKIAHLFKDLWLDEPWWTQGVFDEKTQTIRFWFREKPSGASNPTATTTGIVFDYVRAQELGEGIWPSTMTQLADFAVPAYVNGQREVLYVQHSGQAIFRMGVDTDNRPISSIDLPWMSLEGKDRLAKWLGLIVPYRSSQPVTVSIRYTQHPQDFESAVYQTVQVLPASPGMTEQARVMFGNTARWAQVRLTGTDMEIFPPVEFLAIPTKRVP